MKSTLLSSSVASRSSKRRRSSRIRSNTISSIRCGGVGPGAGPGPTWTLSHFGLRKVVEHESGCIDGAGSGRAVGIHILESEPERQQPVTFHKWIVCCSRYGCIPAIGDYPVLASVAVDYGVCKVFAIYQYLCFGNRYVSVSSSISENIY